MPFVTLNPELMLQALRKGAEYITKSQNIAQEEERSESKAIQQEHSKEYTDERGRKIYGKFTAKVTHMPEPETQIGD